MDQNIFIARHPIFDKYNKIFAYEILFRDEMKNSFSNIDGTTASQSVVQRLLIDFGLNNVSNGKPFFINLTEKFLFNDVILFLPPSQVVFEILENIEPSNTLLQRCIFLQEKGYKLALDDFEYDEKWDDFLEIVDFVKVDFFLVENEEREKILTKIKRNKLITIAEKVECYKDFNQAKNIGYNYFQGYYFCKPSMLSTRKMPENTLNYFQLLQEIQNPSIEFSILENYIKRDISLTYKLLKFINSPIFNFSDKITSIRNALSLLGLKELKKWLALVVIDTLIESRPQELVKISLIRALFCEAIARVINKNNNNDEYYLMGLLSLIDAIIDRDKSEIFKDLKLNKRLHDTLCGNKTELSNILELIIAMEHNELYLVNSIIENLKLNYKLTLETYLNAIIIADALIVEEDNN